MAETSFEPPLLFFCANLAFLLFSSKGNAKGGERVVVYSKRREGRFVFFPAK